MDSKKLLLLLIFLLSSVLTFSQSPTWQWAKKATGSIHDEGIGISLDANNNSYITGYFSSPSITFGTTTLTNIIGGSNIFIAKYDVGGNFQWAKSANVGGHGHAWGITTDPNGNSYIIGTFSSDSITFDSITLVSTGSYEIFVAKFDANGNALWAKSYGGSSYDSGQGIHLSANGDVLITGCFRSQVAIFDTDTLYNASTSDYDIFVGRLDPNGHILWLKSAGGQQMDWGLNITSDATDNCYVTGYFMSHSIVFGSVILTNSVGSNNIFITKYDPNGNVIWAHGVSSGRGNTIHVAPGGDVYLGGYFDSNTATFGSIVLNNTASNCSLFDCNDAFIVKYDSAGNVLWANSAGSIGNDQTYSIRTDQLENVYVVGGYSFGTYNPIYFVNDTLPYPPACTDPVFIARYTPGGHLNCLFSIESGGDDVISLEVIDPNNIMLFGDYQKNPFILGNDTMALMGDENVFIAKFSFQCDVTDIEDIDDGNVFSIQDYSILVNSKKKIDEITVTNILGQPVFHSTPNSNEAQVEVLQQGIYIVNVLIDNKMISRKLVVGKN